MTYLVGITGNSRRLHPNTATFTVNDANESNFTCETTPQH